jgi:putative FmdB family regulatory protein
MPTYAYVCQNCGHKFEQFQSITAKPLQKCPRCGKRRLKRLIGSGAGIIFKGSGFYETDYRSESYTKAAKEEKGAGKEKRDEKKADTTKAETKESKPDGKNKSGNSDN